MGLRRVYNVIMNRLAFIRDKTTHLKPSSPKVIDINENSVVKNYIDELHHAITSDDSFIVALSGDYGTGKSSIIKTYLENYVFNKDRCIIISSSTFLKYKLIDINKKEMSPSTKQEDITGGDNTVDLNELEIVRRIEESILQQIIYRHSNREMEDSEIKRLNQDKRSRRIFSIVYMLFSILFIVLCCTNNQTHFFLNEIYVKYLDELLFSNLIDELLIIHLIVLSLIIIYNVYRFLRYIFYTKKITKVKFETTEIEINSLDSLPFSKNLFEIVYFFSKSNTKIVFIEDLDRFSPDVTRLVMEELKEINRIVNNSKFVSHKVTFVYELKDSIFDDYKQKNKFYDCNISVMPLSTSSNSLYHLHSILGTFKKDYCLDMQLLRIVTRYITDYRTLVNLTNDFDLYKRNTQISNEEDSKLFAITAYKNYYISSDKDLFREDNHLSNKITTILKKRKEVLDKYMVYLSKLEIIYSNESVNPNNDIKEILYLEYLKTTAEGKIFRKTGASESKEEYDKSENVELNNYSLKNEEDREELTEALGVLKKYPKRTVNKLKNLFQNNINNLSSIHPNIELIEKEDFAGESIDFEYELIFANYIDEFYIDYVTSPTINNDLDLNANRYILRVAHDIDASDLYINSRYVQSIAKFVVYNQKSKLVNKWMILHYYNYKSLYDEYEDVKNFYNRMFSELLVLTPQRLKIIKDFIKLEFYNANSLFINDLILRYKFIENLELLINEKIENKAVIDNILLALLAYVELKKETNNFNNIKKYIEENNIGTEEYPYHFNDYLKENLEKNFKKLDIKVSNALLYPKPFQEFVYENNLYRFNDENNNRFNFDFEDLNSNFYKYFCEDYNVFGVDYYIKNKDFLISNESVILDLFTKNDLNRDFKLEMITREKFILKDFDFEFPNNIVKFNHISPKWENINQFIEKTKNTILIDFILNNKDELFFKQDINLIATSAFKEQLIKTTVKNKGEIKYISKLLVSLKGEIKIHPSAKMNKELLDELIMNDVLIYDKTTIKTLLKQGDCNISKFIHNCYNNKKSITSFLNMIEYNEDLIMLLEADVIKENETMGFLRKLASKDIQLIKYFDKLLNKRKKYEISLHTYEKIIKPYNEYFVVEKNKSSYIIRYK